MVVLLVNIEMIWNQVSKNLIRAKRLRNGVKWTITGPVNTDPIICLPQLNSQLGLEFLMKVRAVGGRHLQRHRGNGSNGNSEYRFPSVLLT